MKRNLHKIDATDKILGRLASTIAVLLRGKHKVDFMPHIDGGDMVEVKNFDKIRFTGAKLTQKKYHRTSGYPGGLKTMNLKEKFRVDPKSVLRAAVFNMLPANKLRSRMIKRLKFIK